jgi:GAF domain-containing protein
MQPAPKPHNEAERLESLKQYQILDTLPEEVYNDIARMASEICGTPMAMLSLIDEDRQWVKAKEGLDLIESERDISFCGHAIINPDEPFIVEDARYDERFHDNPFTTGETKIVFYAGVPVVDPEGHALGTLCVLDNRPRDMSTTKMDALKALAKSVQTHFELRKTQMELEKAKAVLQQVQTIAGNLLTNNPRPDQETQLKALQHAARS